MRYSLTFCLHGLVQCLAKNRRRVDNGFLVATCFTFQRYLEPLISIARQLCNFSTIVFDCTAHLITTEPFTWFFLQDEDQSITYTNIISLSATGGIITRQKSIQIIAKCKMENNSTVEAIYITKNNIIQNTTSVGRYKVSISFYDSDSFSKPVLQSPYYVDLNQTLFAQVSLHSSDPNLLVFVDTCIASPQPDFGSLTYDLIRSG